MKIRVQAGGVEEPKPRKTLVEIRIHKGKKGGHVIEHHFNSIQHEPEMHVFGADEGPEAHEHIAQHMGMPMEQEEPDGDEAPPEGAGGGY
jgi:hypothetical protein